VGLILTQADSRKNAMTVSFFSEVAHHPTSLWISIDPRSYTYELIEQSGAFSLVLLHEKQTKPARMCGTVSGRDIDKFSLLKAHRSGDFWYLDDLYASAACRVRSRHQVGDHVMFIADILEGEVETRNSNRRPLLTRDLAT